MRLYSSIPVSSALKLARAEFESWYQRRAREQNIGWALDFSQVQTRFDFQVACCAIKRRGVVLSLGVWGSFLGAGFCFQDQLKKLPMFEKKPF